MIGFFRSIEFWVATVIAVALFYSVGIADTANYVQDTQVWAWSYIIYRLHHSHKLLKAIKGSDMDNETPNS